MIEVSALQEFDTYINMLETIYKDSGVTTEIQIDTLVYIFKLTGDRRAFNLLFNCHEFLLRKLVSTAYNKYKRHLHSDAYEEIWAMASEEFYRRILFYKLPPEAPFSKYVKLYLKQWLNAYTKLMAKHHDRMMTTDLAELRGNNEQNREI